MAILTVTLNPALDLETSVDKVVPGEKLLCAEPSCDPGGGGINVARAVIQLGGAATALIAAGGIPGAMLEAMVTARGVPVERLPAPSELRQNLSVIETDTGNQFRFIFPGHQWDASHLDDLRARLLARAAPEDWLVLSGSLPPGVSPDALVALVQALTGQGVQVIVDTSGPGLEALARARTGLAVLRMNREESELLAGRALARAEDSASFAAQLAQDGVAGIVILARGAEGSVLATPTERWMVAAADVPVVSRTGAGDSFVAGAVLALSRGLPLPEVLSHGSAASSAAVTTAATALCSREMADRLRPHCRVRPL